MRNSASIRNELRADYVINNVANKCVNRNVVVLLIEGTGVVDDTGENVRERSVATHRGSGGVESLAQLGNLPIRQSLRVAAKNNANLNVVTGPFTFNVWAP